MATLAGAVVVFAATRPRKKPVMIMMRMVLTSVLLYAHAMISE
jgi:hypothetical protein